MTEWQLQDAKNRFSAVVEAAVAGDPQRVTKRGKPAVVVLAVGEYERLRRREKATAPSLADLLLAIPQDDEEFERLRDPQCPALRTDQRTGIRSVFKRHYARRVGRRSRMSGSAGNQGRCRLRKGTLRTVAGVGPGVSRM